MQSNEQQGLGDRGRVVREPTGGTVVTDHQHTPEPDTWARRVYDICACGAVRRHSNWRGEPLTMPDQWHVCNLCRLTGQEALA